MYCGWAPFISLATSIQLVYGFFDLFVDREDAKRILGVSSQLWYVKEGKVNQNALNYIVIIPSNINMLTFYWQNHLNSTMPYTLDLKITSSHAIHSPKLKNINRKGLVPNRMTAWGITLNCTGKFITQAHINITLKVPMFPSLQNITTVVIQRKKICTDRHVGDIAVEPVRSQSSANIVYVTIGLLGVFLISVASLAAFNHIRSTKIRNQRNLTNSINLPEPQPIPNNQRDDRSVATTAKVGDLSLTEARRSPLFTNAESAATTTTTVTGPEPQYCDPREGNIGIKLNGLKGSRDYLHIGDLEMEGTFGRIYRGSYSKNENETPFSVIIKTVSDCASEIQRGVLISEGVMFSGFAHDHILPVIAAITTPEKPPLIVFKSNSQINLKKYLQSCHTLLTRDVVSLGSQVLEALMFLHSKLLIHKDVACRNCCINESLKLQVTDCALSRDIFPSDYHCLGDNENRPVKWLAIESLSHKTFSPSSDVWSWGVLIWEIMTLGQQPYVEIDPFEMVPVLRQGVRLAQPINCPDELFKAMTFCWTTHPKERPMVSELLLYLRNFLQHLDRYI